MNKIPTSVYMRLALSFFCTVVGVYLVVTQGIQFNWHFGILAIVILFFAVQTVLILANIWRAITGKDQEDSEEE